MANKYHSPNVEFCGYSIPHPSEPVVNLRIQMYSGLSSVDALYKGLGDLENLFEVIQNKYSDQYKQFKQ